MTGPRKRPRLVPPHQAHLDKFHNFKDCQSCGEKKRLADFALVGNWRKKRAADPKRYKKTCKKCSRAPSAVDTDPNFTPHRARKKRTVKPTVEERRETSAAYKRRRRRETRIKALEYLAGKGCAECGERDPRVLEFDHIEPREKLYSIAKLFGDGFHWGTERLRAEIRKCRVICANCHRLHTIIQRGHYSHDDVQTTLRRIYDQYDIEE